MDSLGVMEHQKGDRLIFRYPNASIPPIGGVVQGRKKSADSTDQRWSTIGTIIDVFGPVKDPWVAVKTRSGEKYDQQSSDFRWQKPREGQQWGKKKGSKRKPSGKTAKKRYLGPRDGDGDKRGPRPSSKGGRKFPSNRSGPKKPPKKKRAS